MVHSFLLIGQSNMAGRGFLHEVQPIRDARIKVLRNGRWQTMWEPIHFDRPFAGIGLGASFAKRWLEDHAVVGKPYELPEVPMLNAAEG